MQKNALAGLLVLTASVMSAQVSITSVNNAASFVADNIATQGSVALVAGNTKSWRNPGVPNFDFTGLLTLTTLDISNPQSPAVVSTNVTNIPTSFDIGYILAPLGNGFFAIAIPPPADSNNGNPTGNGQLAIVDAGDPHNVTVTPVATLPVLNALAVSGGNLYAAYNTGLAIYQVTGQ